MRSLGLLSMRLVTGALFTAHGYAKLFGGTGKAVHPWARRYLGEGFVMALEHGGVENFATSLARMGVPVPRLAAVIVGATEFFGGLMLIGGMFTRLVAFALAVNMAFAIKLVHWKQGMIGTASGYMYALSLLGSALGLVFNGPGTYSVDGAPERWLWRVFAPSVIRRSPPKRSPCGHDGTPATPELVDDGHPPLSEIPNPPRRSGAVWGRV